MRRTPNPQGGKHDFQQHQCQHQPEQPLPQAFGGNLVLRVRTGTALVKVLLHPGQFVVTEDRQLSFALWKHHHKATFRGFFFQGEGVVSEQEVRAMMNAN